MIENVEKGLVSSWVWLVLILWGTLVPGLSQPILTHDLYDSWHKLSGIQLSPDGHVLTYKMGPEKGDNFVVITQTAGDMDSIVVPRGHQLEFSADSRFAALVVQPFFDSTLAAKREERKEAELPNDSLLILDLLTGRQWRADRLVSFSFPPEGGEHLAFLRKPLAVVDTTSADATDQDGGQSPDKADPKKEGQQLWVVNLQHWDTLTWQAVSAYSWSTPGNYLVFQHQGDTMHAAGLYMLNTNTNALQHIHDSAAAYKHFVWNDEGDQLLFLAHTDTVDEQPHAWAMYQWEPGMDTAVVLWDTSSSSLAADWWLSPHRAPAVAENGNIYLSLLPRPKYYPSDTLGDFEKANVDIWSWTDDRLMTLQLNELEEDHQPKFWAIWNGKEMLPLADTALPDVTFTPFYQSNFALGTTDLPYQKEKSWDYPWKKDAYLVDVASGKRHLIAEGISYGLQISPFGRYLLWYDMDSLHWFIHDNRKGKTLNLTAQIPYPIDRQDHDAPHSAPPYGIGGWTEHDKWVYVYDEFDIWQIDPREPEQAICLTKGVGRATNTTYRTERVRKDTTWWAIHEPLLVEGFCHTDKASGYIWLYPSAGDMDTLIWGDFRISNLKKAEKTTVLVWQQEDFTHYPEAHTWRKGNILQRTKTNPNQADYAWGQVELFHWMDFAGEPREGLLYLPAHFDSTRQYPMLVYYYEQVSDQLHRHYAPTPSRSVINPAMYAGNGYVVFMPNIHYKIGYPGKSAYDAILSGTQAVLSRGFVDPTRMGLQGQSWGGYQTAYLITQTNQFAAAMAGAPVSNMFSAYGGIRWGSGLSRAFQYEKTQSRIGATPWQNPHLYWQNSPLFFADQVQTPLLMMHNDEDGAVPWYQGIELFMALRRLNQPVWLLNYNGDKHNLTKWPNRVDLSIRMQQFFDHYLKGEPAPIWMTTGVPATLKGKESGFEIR